MIDKALMEEPIYEKPKSISEWVKREPDHDQQVQKPKNMSDKKSHGCYYGMAPSVSYQSWLFYILAINQFI